MFIADGKTNNAENFKEAFKNGGKIVLKEGVYLTGPIEIPSNTHLHLNKGAVIKFIDDFAIYPPVYTRWEGVKCYAMHPCVYVKDACDVKITGEGTIDGSGEAWWEKSHMNRVTQTGPVSDIENKFASLNPGYDDQPGGGGGRQMQFLRPPLVQIHNSKRVVIEGVTIQNSPFWTIHPLFSEDIVFKNLTVQNPHDGPNTDGIDIESCSNVKVIDCFVHVGDDGIALKSGSGPDGIADNVPTTNVIIQGCTVQAAHGGAVIGSETAAGINNVIVRDCTFDGTDRGIRIKSRRGRGGAIHDLEFSNIKMVRNFCPLVVNMYYRCGSNDPELFSLDKKEITIETPSVYNVKIENCRGEMSRASAGMIVGLPEMPVKNLSIKDCYFAVDQNTDMDVNESDMYVGLPNPDGRGFRLRNVDGLKLENVVVEGATKPILLEDNTTLV